VRAGVPPKSRKYLRPVANYRYLAEDAGTFPGRSLIPASVRWPLDRTPQRRFLVCAEIPDAEEFRIRVARELLLRLLHGLISKGPDRTICQLYESTGSAQGECSEQFAGDPGG
jgi:hypothetical protein